MDQFDPKQPNESYYLGFDFEASFTDDNGVVYDSVSSVNDIAVIDSDGVDVTSDLVDESKTLISGSLVKIWIQNGIDGETYQITVRVTGALLSETFEMDALLLVSEM